MASPANPRTAVDEDEDRRVRLGGAKKVELLDPVVAIGAALGLANPGTGASAVLRPALVELEDIGLIDRLVIGSVKFDLVEIEKDQRTLLMRRRSAIRIGCAATRGG